MVAAADRRQRVPKAPIVSEVFSHDPERGVGSGRIRRALATKRESARRQGKAEQFMMREDARRQVVALWPAWAKANNVEKGTGSDALLFFNFLQDKRPDLLAFEGSGDKWQAVHGWLINGHLVTD